MRVKDDVRPGMGGAHERIEDDEIDLLEIVRTLWRGKLLILLAMLAALTVGATYAVVLAVPKYATSTTLMLEARGDQIVDLQSVVSGVSAETESMNTELEVITSRGLIAKLVRALDLTMDPEFNPSLRPEPAISLGKIIAATKRLVGVPVTSEDAPSELNIFNNTVARVRQAVTPSVQRNTYVFTIRVESWSPQKSVLIANTLAELYIEDQVDVKFRKTEQAASWLSDRVVQLEQELKDKEEAISQMRGSSEFVDPSGLTARNLQLSEARQRASNQVAERARSEARLDSLRSARAANDLEAMLEAADDIGLRRIAERAQGDAVLTEGSAFLQRYDQIVDRAEIDLQRASSQAEALAGAVDRLQEDFARQSDKLTELQQLERDLQATTVLYETFLTRLKETTVQQGIQGADARVLSESVNGRKVAPRTGRVLAMSGVLGLMIGAGIVLLYEMTRRGFRSTDELEAATGYPVLGQVPKIALKARRNLINYLRTKPTSAAAEAVRNLRTSILLSDLDNPPQVIMSTSSVPGEGKTTQAVSLAQNLSGLGKKVLLFEGDVRRRTLNEYFTTEATAGFISVLSGDVDFRDAIQRSDELGADVLLGQKSNVNAADLFASDRFREFLEFLRKHYDYIIIDTPPVLVVPDARVIGQHVDAIIYSVAWDRTSRNQVTDGLRALSSVNLRVAGTVLAQIDAKGMKRYGYGGRYGAYSQYGNRYYDN
ncbi:GumC family protein [Pseudooceanicola aestuarii]|uniref:GumC family protein n=1 Tax=Pseudooceanicola aestuarii TaxID=2697319 RepID=UPI001EF84E5C|nr:polysaccharide biosynthesis tyrosine autokinase [Pseudooceanicola aestuarii]